MAILNKIDIVDNFCYTFSIMAFGLRDSGLIAGDRFFIIEESFLFFL